MRIISGNLKGKKLSFLNSSTTRPLKDMVKESIFNVILHSNLVDISIKNSTVLDLYSGTGSFGIECISRGANKVTFVENNNEAIKNLNNNLRKLSIEKKTSLFPIEVELFFDKISKENKFDIIFFDPPFKENKFNNVLKKIKELEIFKKKKLSNNTQRDKN